MLAFLPVCLAGGARQWVTLALASLSSSFLSHLECAALQALCQLVAPGLSPDLESTCRCEYPSTCKTDYLYGCRIRILACYFYQIWQGVSRLLRLSVEWVALQTSVGIYQGIYWGTSSELVLFRCESIDTMILPQCL